MDKYIVAYVDGSWYVLEFVRDEYLSSGVYKEMTQAKSRGNADKVADAMNEAMRAQDRDNWL